MHRPAPGRYVTVTTAGEPFQAFVPVPLPPEPPVVWLATLRRRFDAALVALPGPQRPHAVCRDPRQSSEQVALNGERPMEDADLTVSHV